MDLSLILIILALVVFLIGAVDPRTPPVRPNLTCAGLGLLALAWLVMRSK